MILTIAVIGAALFRNQKDIIMRSIIMVNITMKSMHIGMINFTIMKGMAMKNIAVAVVHRDMNTKNHEEAGKKDRTLDLVHAHLLTGAATTEKHPNINQEKIKRNEKNILDKLVPSTTLNMTTFTNPISM